MKVLYIDDHRLLAHSVKRLLDRTYVVDLRLTGREGLDAASHTKYAIILLDLCLPDMSGLEVCRELRKMGITAPILILTAQKDPEMSVQLLNCGADDYVTKPFNTEVLKARISALLRRGNEMQDEKIVDVADLEVNITRRKVSRSGKDIQLRRKEFDILEYLATNRGRTLTRAMIIDHVWESGKEGWNNTVDVHIKSLRYKVDRPFDKALIKTAYGVGYMIDDA
jgi:DNA-binding response OmpR family regulator